MANGKDRPLLEFLMDAVSVTALLVMVALIGIQSSRAVMSLGEARAERRIEAMKADLADVAERQVLHYLDVSEFAGSAEDLSFVGTDGVAISVVVTDTGWAATASHAELGDDRGCAVFFGSVPLPVGPVQPTTPGEVACTE